MEQASLRQRVKGKGRPQPGGWRDTVCTCDVSTTAVLPVAVQHSIQDVCNCDVKSVFIGGRADRHRECDFGQSRRRARWGGVGQVGRGRPRSGISSADTRATCVRIQTEDRLCHSVLTASKLDAVSTVSHRQRIDTNIQTAPGGNGRTGRRRGGTDDHVTPFYFLLLCVYFRRGHGGNENHTGAGMSSRAGARRQYL